MDNIFDRSVLKSLRDLERQTNQDIVSEMVSEFIRDTSMSVKEMRTLLDALKFVELARIAHSLKSSSANIGAIAISEACERIESLILNEKKNDADKLNLFVGDIENILTPTLELLKAA